MSRAVKRGQTFSWSKLKLRFSWLRHWLKKRPEPLTLLLMTRGHLEVQKIHLKPKWITRLKYSGVVAAFLLVVSSIIFINFLISFPSRYRLEQENSALKLELTSLQYNLDTLETTVDRVYRFNQKLRALTDVDKEFAKRKGPLGQGGGESEEVEEDVYDFGDYQISEANLVIGDENSEVLGRRERFLVEKLYSWISRIYKDSELESQSVEELYEVLKGRKLQLASTPSIIPVRGWVTSHFGYRLDPFSGRRTFHKGMDVAAKTGTPIVSPAEGIVSYSGRYGSYGNAVMVFHGYGVSSLYAHAEDLLVRVGQRVKRGDILATVGSTGRSTSSHLHYEIIAHGVRVDPRKYVLDRSL